VLEPHALERLGNLLDALAVRGLRIGRGTAQCTDYGSEKPAPKIMGAWGKWFESMKDIIDMGGISVIVERSRKLKQRIRHWA
jgi:hypothetical protein